MSGKHAAPAANETTQPPSADERCDRCNAAGKLRVMIAGGGQLVFCGHHANKYAEELVKVALQVSVAPDFAWRGHEIQWHGITEAAKQIEANPADLGRRPETLADVLESEAQ